MNEFLQFYPWFFSTIVFVGMWSLCWKAFSANSDLSRLLAAQPAQPLPPAAPPPVTTVKPTPPPAPSGPFAGAPAWFQWALHEVGFRETGNNQGIERYIQLAHTGSPGDPWCAIFANAALESVGIAGTKSPSSQSFRSSPNFVQLPGPAVGALVVYWRGSKDSGLGHVGFYRGEDTNRIWTLGGNENDMVQIEALPKSSATFGLIGYWWPKSVPLPQVGPVIMPTGSSVSVTTPPVQSTPAPAAAAGAVQKNIIATYEGLAGQTGAYGTKIDDSVPAVALPLHFTGTRPRVRVTEVKSGVSIDCDIVDVGPWMENDPYWQTGARPMAEVAWQSRTPLQGGPNKGRIPNGAGIDLSLAAAKAVQIDGKGLVDWQFLTAPT